MDSLLVEIIIIMCMNCIWWLSVYAWLFSTSCCMEMWTASFCWRVETELNIGQSAAYIIASDLMMEDHWWSSWIWLGITFSNGITDIQFLLGRYYFKHRHVFYWLPIDFSFPGLLGQMFNWYQNQSFSSHLMISMVDWGVCWATSCRRWKTHFCYCWWSTGLC